MGRRPQVYPRVCGGTACASTPWPFGWGLSPRVRGNPRDPVGSGGDCGSIPACAGEPRTRCRTLGRGGVYPRVCGGTLVNRAVPSTTRGLSPRVRGNRQVSEQNGPYQRSIPACAGEPNRATPVVYADAVYPRVCGGTTRHIPASGNSTGLSPRVRGNPCVSSVWACSVGSIPACAGGTALQIAGRLDRTGLSPRVRGNPQWP